MLKILYLVIAGYQDGVINVLNVSTQSVLGTLSGHTDNVLALKMLTSDGTLLASASKDLTIIIWNLTSFTKITSMAGRLKYQ